jgi:hypothetical protein
MSKSVSPVFGLVFIGLGTIVMIAGWVYSQSIKQAYPTVVVALPSALLIYTGLLKIRASQRPQ